MFKKIDFENLRHFTASWRLGFFVLLCLVLGGTSQDIVNFKLPLYLLSLVLIAAALTSTRRRHLTSLKHVPELFGGLLILLYAIYLLPLPSAVWSNLPLRQDVAKGFDLIGMDRPWLPLSLSPEKTLFSTFDFLPLIAISLIFRLQASHKEKTNALLTIILLGVFSTFLGAWQMLSGNENILYNIVSVGLPIGVFSNINHQACFLAMVLPLSLLMAFNAESFIPSESRKFQLFGFVGSCIITLGIFLSNSLASYLFLLITLPTSLFVIFRGRWRLHYIFLLMLIIIIGLVTDFVVFGDHTHELNYKIINRGESSISRSEIFANTWEIIKNTKFIGSGPGSFLETYRAIEDRSLMSNIFIPQAHNDYLQITLELGVMGALLTFGFLIWFLRTIIRVFRLPKKLKKFSTIIVLSLLCPLVHSTIDYPLRTITVAVTFYLLLLFLDNNSNLEEVKS